MGLIDPLLGICSEYATDETVSARRHQGITGAGTNVTHLRSHEGGYEMAGFRDEATCRKTVADTTED